MRRVRCSRRHLTGLLRSCPAVDTRPSRLLAATAHPGTDELRVLQELVDRGLLSPEELARWRGPDPSGRAGD